MLLFEHEQSEEERRMVRLNRQRSQTYSTFRIPAFSKEWIFVMLVGFQFLLSMAYLTPIYFMESKFFLSLFPSFLLDFSWMHLEIRPVLTRKVTSILVYSTHIGLSKQLGASINGWFNGASFVARILSGILADLISTDVVLIMCVWTNALSILVIWTFAKSFPAYLFFAIVYGISFSGTSTVTPVMVADYYGKIEWSERSMVLR